MPPARELHTQELRETVRAAFAHYDTDASGSIDARELRSLVAALGGYLIEKELADALSSLDRDGSGGIDEDEFAAWWMAQSGDLDGDGQVGELERAMERVKASGQDRFRVDIHVAAWRGDAAAVQRLVQNDADLVNEVDATEYGGGNTPLHYAAYQGHVDVCAALVTSGAKVNAPNGAGCTALFLAVQQSRSAVVALLLEHDADIRVAEREHKLTAVDVCTDDEILAEFRKRSGGVPCAPDAPTVVAAKETALVIQWATPTDRHDQLAPISAYKPTECAIGELQPDTQYSVQVAAVNLHGISPFSRASASVRTLPARPPPPVELRARGLDASSVELTWHHAAPDAVTSFVVQQRVDEASDLWKAVGKVAADDSQSRLVVANLFGGRKYRFRVAARSARRGQSDFSAIVETRTLGEQATPPPRAAVASGTRKARAALRDVVGAVHKLRPQVQQGDEAPRPAPALKYPQPQDAVEQPRAAQRLPPVAGAMRSVRPTGEIPSTATGRRILSTVASVEHGTAEAKRTTPPAGDAAGGGERHQEKRHAHGGDGSGSEDDEHVYFSDASEEEEEEEGDAV